MLKGKENDTNVFCESGPTKKSVQAKKIIWSYDNSGPINKKKSV